MGNGGLKGGGEGEGHAWHIDVQLKHFNVCNVG